MIVSYGNKLLVVLAIAIFIGGAAMSEKVIDDHRSIKPADSPNMPEVVAQPPLKLPAVTAKTELPSVAPIPSAAVTPPPPYLPKTSESSIDTEFIKVRNQAWEFNINIAESAWKKTCTSTSPNYEICTKIKEALNLLLRERNLDYSNRSQVKEYEEELIAKKELLNQLIKNPAIDSKTPLFDSLVTFRNKIAEKVDFYQRENNAYYLFKDIIDHGNKISSPFGKASDWLKYTPQERLSAIRKLYSNPEKYKDVFKWLLREKEKVRSRIENDPRQLEILEQKFNEIFSDFGYDYGVVARLNSFYKINLKKQFNDSEIELLRTNSGFGEEIKNSIKLIANFSKIEDKNIGGFKLELEKQYKTLNEYVAKLRDQAPPNSQLPNFDEILGILRTMISIQDKRMEYLNSVQSTAPMNINNPEVIAKLNSMWLHHLAVEDREPIQIGDTVYLPPIKEGPDKGKILTKSVAEFTPLKVVNDNESGTENHTEINDPVSFQAFLNKKENQDANYKVLRDLGWGTLIDPRRNAPVKIGKFMVLPKDHEGKYQVISELEFNEIVKKQIADKPDRDKLNAAGINPTRDGILLSNPAKALELLKTDPELLKAFDRQFGGLGTNMILADLNEQAHLARRLQPLDSYPAKTWLPNYNKAFELAEKGELNESNPDIHYMTPSNRSIFLAYSNLRKTEIQLQKTGTVLSDAQKLSLAESKAFIATQLYKTAENGRLGTEKGGLRDKIHAAIDVGQTEKDYLELFNKENPIIKPKYNATQAYRIRDAVIADLNSILNAKPPQDLETLLKEAAKTSPFDVFLSDGTLKRGNQAVPLVDQVYANLLALAKRVNDIDPALAQSITSTASMISKSLAERTTQNAEEYAREVRREIAFAVLSVASLGALQAFSAATRLVQIASGAEKAYRSFRLAEISLHAFKGSATQILKSTALQAGLGAGFGSSFYTAGKFAEYYDKKRKYEESVSNGTAKGPGPELDFSFVDLAAETYKGAVIGGALSFSPALAEGAGAYFMVTQIQDGTHQFQKEDYAQAFVSLFGGQVAAPGLVAKITRPQDAALRAKAKVESEARAKVEAEAKTKVEKPPPKEKTATKPSEEVTPLIPKVKHAKVEDVVPADIPVTLPENVKQGLKEIKEAYEVAANKRPETFGSNDFRPRLTFEEARVMAEKLLDAKATTAQKDQLAAYILLRSYGKAVQKNSSGKDELAPPPLDLPYQSKDHQAVIDKTIMDHDIAVNEAGFKVATPSRLGDPNFTPTYTRVYQEGKPMSQKEYEAQVKEARKGFELGEEAMILTDIHLEPIDPMNPGKTILSNQRLDNQTLQYLSKLPKKGPPLIVKFGGDIVDAPATSKMTALEKKNLIKESYAKLLEANPRIILDVMNGNHEGVRITGERTFEIQNSAGNKLNLTIEGGLWKNKDTLFPKERVLTAEELAIIKEIESIYPSDPKSKFKAVDETLVFAATRELYLSGKYGRGEGSRIVISGNKSDTLYYIGETEDGRKMYMAHIPPVDGPNIRRSIRPQVGETKNFNLKGDEIIFFGDQHSAYTIGENAGKGTGPTFVGVGPVTNKGFVPATEAPFGAFINLKTGKVTHFVFSGEAMGGVPKATPQVYYDKINPKRYLDKPVTPPEGTVPSGIDLTKKAEMPIPKPEPIVEPALPSKTEKNPTSAVEPKFTVKEKYTKSDATDVLNNSLSVARNEGNGVDKKPHADKHIMTGKKSFEELAIDKAVDGQEFTAWENQGQSAAVLTKALNENLPIVKAVLEGRKPTRVIVKFDPLDCFVAVKDGVRLGPVKVFKATTAVVIFEYHPQYGVIVRTLFPDYQASIR